MRGTCLPYSIRLGHGNCGDPSEGKKDVHARGRLEPDVAVVTLSETAKQCKVQTRFAVR